MSYKKVPAEGSEVMREAARILEVVNTTSRPKTEQEWASHNATRESFTSPQRVRAAMDPGCAGYLVDALRAWARMGELDSDLMNRVGGPEMYSLAQRIVTGEAL